MTPFNWIVAVLVLLAGGTSAGIGQDTPPTESGDRSELIQKILAANAPHDAAEHFSALFHKCEANELKRYQASKYDTVALQAAWREVDLTVPEKEAPRVVRPDRDQLARFLGFLEGRGRVQTPGWWSEALLDARANRRGNIYAGGLNVAEVDDKPPAKVPPEPPNIARMASQTVLTLGKTSITMPVDLTEKIRLGGSRDHVSALLTPTRCFVAAYDDVGSPYQLACVDRKSSKIIWTSAVWGSWWGHATGQHRQWVEITIQGDRVVVFGIASVGFHAEAFQAVDGKNLWRFSNAYSY